jgi:predicted RNA-binding Zn ribbon-like protein
MVKLLSGQPTDSAPPGFHFHFTGSALCLDFANTLSWRLSSQPIERITTFQELSSWARQAGLVSRTQAKRLEAEAAAHPRHSRHLLDQARSLRELIFAVFAAVSEDRSPAEADLRQLQRRIQQAIAHSRLRPGASSYGWESVAAGSTADWLLWSIVRSAGDLLTSSDLRLVGQCSGRDCRWLWVDRTRNQSRRWCAMSACGNRAKAQRHYARVSRAK